MAYVDGFVLAVKKDRLDDYKKMAATFGSVWKDHGALSYVETVGEDTPYGKTTSFPRAVMATEDEVVVFSWITYASKADRDAINAKVMADPRIKHDPNDHPFDGKRLIHGGFETFLEL